LLQQAVAQFVWLCLEAAAAHRATGAASAAEAKCRGALGWLCSNHQPGASCRRQPTRKSRAGRPAGHHGTGWHAAAGAAGPARVLFRASGCHRRSALRKRFGWRLRSSDTLWYCDVSRGGGCRRPTSARCWEARAAKSRPATAGTFAWRQWQHGLAVRAGSGRLQRQRPGSAQLRRSVLPQQQPALDARRPRDTCTTMVVLRQTVLRC
jgi:hypothetical protein